MQRKNQRNQSSLPKSGTDLASSRCDARAGELAIKINADRVLTRDRLHKNILCLSFSTIGNLAYCLPKYPLLMYISAFPSVFGVQLTGHQSRALIMPSATMRKISGAL